MLSEPRRPSARREIDLQGKIVMSGLFDPHVHFGVADKFGGDGTFPLAIGFPLAAGFNPIAVIHVGTVRIWKKRVAAKSAGCSNARHSLTSTPCTRRGCGYRAILTTPAIFYRRPYCAPIDFFHQYTPGTNRREWLLTILYNNFRSGYRGGGREQVSLTPEDFEREIEGLSVRGNQALTNPEMLVSEHVLDHEVSAARVTA